MAINLKLYHSNMYFFEALQRFLIKNGQDAELITSDVFFELGNSLVLAQASNGKFTVDKRPVFRKLSEYDQYFHRMSDKYVLFMTGIGGDAEDCYIVVGAENPAMLAEFASGIDDTFVPYALMNSDNPVVITSEFRRIRYFSSLVENVVGVQFYTQVLNLVIKSVITPGEELYVVTWEKLDIDFTYKTIVELKAGGALETVEEVYIEDVRDYEGIAPCWTITSSKTHEFIDRLFEVCLDSLDPVLILPKPKSLQALRELLRTFAYHSRTIMVGPTNPSNGGAIPVPTVLKPFLEHFDWLFVVNLNDLDDYLHLFCSKNNCFVQEFVWAAEADTSAKVEIAGFF